MRSLFLFSVIASVWISATCFAQGPGMDQGPGGPGQVQSGGSGQGMQQGPGGMGGRDQGPPPEAIDACKGKSTGTSCSFTGRRGEQLTGTCMTPDSSRPVACCPPRGGQGPGSGPNAVQKSSMGRSY